MIETLLIIEDEKLLGSELSRHYRQLGWEVLLATNLAEAKELLLNKKIDPLLILSDMNLPDGHALDFMEKIKKILAIPVIPKMAKAKQCRGHLQNGCS
jgi:Response regulator containing CheY-like receiver, AAA-type ATPase, and DNA-binding domains